MSTTHLDKVAAEDALPEQTSPLDWLMPLVRRRWWLLLTPLMAGALGYGASFLQRESYTAGATFLPPQQQQSSSLSAMASLGALSGLAGAGVLRAPGEQYASLLQTLYVRERLIQEFKLDMLYDTTYREDTLRELGKRVRVVVGKRDGLINLQVDDESPLRAAEIANRHIELLRELTGKLALTEAQQRRGFFEGQLKDTKNRLIHAQRSLEASGFNAGALRAEPKASADGYARLRAEVTAAEVRLTALRQSLADSTPEVQQQLSILGSLRRQLSGLESAVAANGGPDYIGLYREYKYQETLFELYSRQFELARMDEAKDGGFIQVVDAATPPQKRSSPKRRFIALGAAAGALVLMVAGLLGQQALRRVREDPAHARSLNHLREAMKRG